MTDTLLAKLRTATEMNEELFYEVAAHVLPISAGGDKWDLPAKIAEYMDVGAWTDAALSLVDGNPLRRLEFTNEGARAGLFGQDIESIPFEGNAATPALALCIARLEAHEATKS